MLSSFSIIVGLAALFSLINFKLLKLPYTIGLTLISLVFALLLNLSQFISPGIYNYFCGVIYEADFSNLLFNGLLSFLLFAGALHINIKQLAKERWSVLLFATLGVLISTLLIGFGLKWLSLLFSFEIPLIYCLLFGALISPTDPIAVLSILKSTNVTKSLQLKIEGESLFNDGIGVVVFTGILIFLPDSMINEGGALAEIGTIFLEEVVGGLAFGLALGYLGYFLINMACKNPQLATILTLGIVMTGSTVAHVFHFSAPLAMVVSGLVIGNKLDINHAEHSPAKQAINEFWEMLDYLLNAVLFVLMGLALHLIHFEWTPFIMGIIAIGLVLLARFTSILATYSLLNHKDDMTPLATIKILTWGGLRGGISIALALSLTNQEGFSSIILITYVVVIFSVLVQGLTIGRLVKKLIK